MARLPAAPGPRRRWPRRALLGCGVLALAACEYRVPPDDERFPRDVLQFHEAPLFPDAGELPGMQLARIAPAASQPEDGEWIRPLKDYAGSRYSPLAQITTENVGQLRLEWLFDLGLARGQEATPLVVNHTMYVVTSFPNLLYAFDLTQQGPAVRWVYDPEPLRAAQGAACCDHVNRGAVYANGRLFYATLDAQAVAVDAETGREIWKNRIGDINIAETITMSPLAIGNVVLFGNSGGEFGVRGWLKALDIDSGEVLWTAYSTGPDEDVLIGPEFRPFYEADRGEHLGVRTWPHEAWRTGGGTVWGWLTYDPELDLVYYGTANAGPWNPEQRAGENKWTATIFARRPMTGEAVWAYQWDPHNVYAWDGVNENILLDLPVDGVMRRVLVRAERNGYVYILDRATGEVLDASPYMHSTVVQGVDLRTGQPVQDWSKMPGFGRTVHGICPAVPGAKDWEPMAFSPRTGLLYIPANNLCADMAGMEANYIAGTPFMGISAKMYAGPGDYLGEVIAWDPINRRKVWARPERFLTWSGPLATAGDVVFYATLDRWFYAVDARTGQTLWRYRLETGSIAPPMTYTGPDGRQYVAVLSGPGGWAGSIVSVPLDPRDQSADKGMVNAMQDLPNYTGRGGYLYVFALPPVAPTPPAPGDAPNGLLAAPAPGQAPGAVRPTPQTDDEDEPEAGEEEEDGEEPAPAVDVGDGTGGSG
jgi:lanthanide-dependent methanol dehydrogenase